MAFGKRKTEDVESFEAETSEKPEKPVRKTAEERKLEAQERKQQIKEIKAKRKELKAELKLNGMKNKRDMEFFAKEVGLEYPKGTMQYSLARTGAFLSGVGNIIGASITLPGLLMTLSVLLAGIFMIAYISEERGHFTINLTADMLKEGFQLSDTPDFDDPETRLFAEEIENSNATSIYEITRKVNEVDGSHNGPGYMAQTFYIRNNGTETTDYGYTVNIISETLNTGKAAWVMFFEDDKQIIYASPLDDGTPENLWGYPEPPFYDMAYYPDDQYEKKDDRWSIITTPFIDSKTALQGYVTDFEPGEVKKYTCVVWLEGDDPDCNNNILGGHVGFNVQFERLGEDTEGYFKGLFREEYLNTYFGMDVDDTGEETDRDVKANTTSEATHADTANTDATE